MSARIAYLVEYPTISGGEQSLFTLLKYLDRKRFEPIVVGPVQGSLAEALGARDVRLIQDPGDSRARVRCLREAGIDMIHANSLSMGCRSGPLSLAVGVPALSHVRDIQRLGRDRKEALTRNRRLLAVSRATAGALVDQGIHPDLVRVVYNGIDAREFPSRVDSGRRLRRELGIREAVPLVGNLGQICLRKAQDVFLKAARRVAAEMPDVHFLLAGARFSRKAESLEFETALHAAADVPVLRGRVHFLGWRKDAPAVVAGLDVLAHAAHQEPLGRVLLEALAAGTPVVATEVGGTPEIIEAGRTGLLVPRGDDEGLAAGILGILESESLAQSLANVGLDRVRRIFNPAQAAGSVQSQYETLLSRS